MSSTDQALIRETAAALRHCCDRILNDGAALTLSAPALRVLHAHFSSLFPAPVRGEFAPATASSLVATETLHELQFLRDLAQLTSALCVTAGSPPAESPVPLGDFSRLERLRLLDVPVCWVEGLQARRPYLRALRCDGGADSLWQLLAACGADQSSPFLWEELTELCVTRCRLTAVDRDALRLTPHLTDLDLSHNRVAVCDGLECLAGLQRLNLTANTLTAVPVLSMPAHLALRWLSLRGNKLEALEGLEDMVSLEHLDLSYNLLMSHGVLQPLLELRRLRNLQLSGNPLCCLSDHRRRTARHLHHNCLTGQLLLDGRRLQSSEVPRRPDPPASRPVLRPSSSTASAGPPPSPAAAARLGRPPGQPGRRVRSAAGSIGTGDKASNGDTPRAGRRRSKRRSRVNMADISDMDSTASLTGGLASSLEGVTEAADSCGGAAESELPSHLVTRERIESLRQQMGADWLHSRGGARVQELLGLPAQPPPTFSVGSVPIESPASRAVNGTGSAGATPPSAARSTPPGADRPPAPPAADGAAAAPEPPPEPSLYPSREARAGHSWEHDSSQEEDEEEEEVVCLVVAERLVRPGVQEDVMLTVTATAVKEKELDAGRTVAEWDLRCVEACHVTKMEPLTVQLNFDTVKKEKRERNYTMEQSEWEELSSALLPIIEARLASELAANALQCMKCAAEFSDALAKTTAAHRDVKAGRTKHVQTCPNCGSNMIIRAERVSHPNAEVAPSPGSLPKVIPKRPPLKKRLSSKKLVASTPRHMMDEKAEAALLGSTPTGAEAVDAEHVSSETSSNHTRPATRTDSSVSVVTPEPEPVVRPGGRQTGHTTPERADSVPVRSDSDVEVISNPSESSIDVIMDSTTRSETEESHTRPVAEGREAAAAGRSAAPGGAVRAAEPPMEESSSSGSMTASVCTVRDKRVCAAPHPPPPAPAPASDVADLSCTLTPESAASDALDCSAISPINTSAISPINTSATSRECCNQSAAAAPNDSRCSQALLDGWRRGGDSESESESDSVEEVGSGAVRFWHDEPTRLDHRLQLHLDMNVLDDDEQVVCVSKVTCALEPQYQQQECVLVVTSSTLHLLEITGDDSDQLERWLRPRLTRPLTEVTSIGPLLHCHGLALQVTGREPSLNTQLLVVTRDAARGRRLLQHLTESCPVAAPTDRWQATQRLQVESMLSGDAGADLSLQQLLFLQLLRDESDSVDSDSEPVPVMLCMTPSDLLLMECDLRWLVPGHGDVKIPMRDREKVANIVGLELLRCASAGRPGLRLLFQDASSGTEHSWRLSAASRATVAELVAGLEQPWAAAGQPLQAACDLYRTAEGDLLRLGRCGAPLTASWLRVTAEPRTNE
ncbi:serine/threonine-protein kinase 11-interacting protein-like [Amphibalanus amphitrite]|uniref:serine/threonine-protein kinase 11-interacting protein-like n=1 Tax=Amphibalanus amphitrite TaxID=1232801 RepID=UPI001C9049E3|nr:serine/threonine-protein kinase 11-interacting protein-like [Amphibalanus amphitrite]XP_043220079.1 serine/threonine-protein kinase 11-interacting protein-like [Amphibalanus amphitrite]